MADFKGTAWNCSVSLTELIECQVRPRTFLVLFDTLCASFLSTIDPRDVVLQYDFVIEEEQLQGWLQDYLSNGRLTFQE